MQSLWFYEMREDFSVNLNDLLRRWRALTHKDELDQELDEELQLSSRSRHRAKHQKRHELRKTHVTRH